MSNLRAAQDAPKPQSILEGQLSAIESRLKTLSELDARIGSAVGRLVNPRPADTGKGAESQPTPSTVEGQLQSISRTLDNLIVGFQDHADTLDAAI